MSERVVAISVDDDSRDEDDDPSEDETTLFENILNLKIGLKSEIKSIENATQLKKELEYMASFNES